MRVEFQTADLAKHVGGEKKGEAVDLKQTSAWVIHFAGLLTAQLRVALGHPKESAPGSVLVTARKEQSTDDAATAGVVLEIDAETSGTRETDWKFQTVDPPPAQLVSILTEKFGGRILDQAA
ncbi:hypothetical protein HYW83_05635 [Candidatus Peregrinibacteria bacterium]|nr:hypothetical protein [Candidatus Peregrinibacteria bacterium]